jgi:hypothetical protein
LPPPPARRTVETERRVSLCMLKEQEKRKKILEQQERESGSSEKMCVREIEREREREVIRVLVGVSDRGLGRFWRYGYGNTHAPGCGGIVVI